MEWSWWTGLVAFVTGVLLVWLAVIAALWRNRPDRLYAGELVRLLPDLIRLVRRLSADPTLPRGVRWRLWLLFGYLAMPIDLVPDFVPVLGYADDAIVVALTLRSVARRAGKDAVARHWPGTPEGLAAVLRLASVAGAA